MSDCSFLLHIHEKIKSWDIGGWCVLKILDMGAGSEMKFMFK